MTNHLPLKRITRLAYGDALAADSRVDGKYAVVGSGGVSGTHNSRNFRAPGIVIGRKGSFGSIHWIPGGGFAIDTAYYIDEACTSANLRWLYYSLQGIDLRGASQDVGVPGLSRDSAYQVLTPVPPPLEEQRRIADFLDAETARIDALHRLRDQQLLLIDEAAVSRAFDSVAGRNIGGPRKTSGLRWLGSVPAAWRVAAVSHLYEVELGKMLNEERSTGEHLRPYLRVANVQWDEIDCDNLALMNFPPDQLSRYGLQKGDLLVCEGGS